METLVLPAQDQLACHQNGRSKRILRTSSMQPGSPGNSCASASQYGPASGFAGNVTSLRDGGYFQPDASVSGSPALVEKHSFFVAKTLAFRIFHPSNRSQSRGSSSFPRSAASDFSLQGAHVTSSGSANASFRSFSVPKGHGWKRSEPRKAPESEGMHTSKDATSESMSGQFKPKKKCTAEAKAVGGTHLPRKSEGSSGSGRSSFERCSINSPEKHEGVSVGSGSSAGKDGPKTIRVTPAVAILQRPKTKDAAMSNLARVLAGGGEALNLLSTVSSSVCQSGGVFQDCTGETVSTKSSFCGRVDFHETPLGNGVMSLNLSGSNEKCKLPRASKSSDAVMVCTSGRTMETVWRETVACMHPDRPGGAQPILERQDRNLLSDDLKAMFTGSFLITDEASTREDFSASSPPINERWAGPGYSNSPPPSSLPLPKFSMRQLRTTSLEIPLTEVEFCDDAFGSGSLSAPATPSRCLHSLPSELSVTAGVLGLSLDVASATKDLRRILNLDADI